MDSLNLTQINFEKNDKIVTGELHPQTSISTLSEDTTVSAVNEKSSSDLNQVQPSNANESTAKSNTNRKRKRPNESKKSRKKKKATLEQTLSDKPNKKPDVEVNELTVAQMLDPLTMVVVDLRYPKVALTPDHLEKLRLTVREETNKLPHEQWPKFDDSFCMGGALVIIAASKSSKDWFCKHFHVLKRDIGEKARVECAQILQRFWRAIMKVPDTSASGESPFAVLQRLGKYNPTLNTGLWKVYTDIPVKVGEDRTENDVREKERCLNLGIPVFDIAPLKALHWRLFYDMGTVRLKLKGAIGKKCLVAYESQ